MNITTDYSEESSIYLNHESYIDFKSALESLTKDELILLKLHFIHGLSLQELAFVFDKHVVNVCIKRKKILEKLKVFLDKE